MLYCWQSGLLENLTKVWAENPFTNVYGYITPNNIIQVKLSSGNQLLWYICTEVLHYIFNVLLWESRGNLSINTEFFHSEFFSVYWIYLNKKSYYNSFSTLQSNILSLLHKFMKPPIAVCGQKIYELLNSHDPPITTTQLSRKINPT